jgi:HSP20 family protein
MEVVTMLMFDPFFREFDRPTHQLLGATVRPAVMPMDAWRAGDRFVVEFDLPGINPESLDLNIENGVLTVRAERAEVDAGMNWLVAERPTGVLSRQLVLSTDLDADKIQADYHDGVLRLTIPVAEEVKPRKIAIEHRAGQKAIDA